MRRAVLAVVAIALSGSAQPVAADAAKARKLNTQGMAAYKRQHYEEALAKFDQAIAEDATMVLAHYNAASMASLITDNPRVIKELEWLASSTDPAAAKALATGKTDRDLLYASMHPRVRALLGLPPLDQMDLATLVTERGGVWGIDGSACGGEAITITFRKGGKFSMRQEFACDETDAVSTENGTWAVKGGVLTLTSKKVFAGGAPAALETCSRGDDGSWCLALGGDVGDSAHRGEGTMD